MGWGVRDGGVRGGVINSLILTHYPPSTHHAAESATPHPPTILHAAESATPHPLTTLC